MALPKYLMWLILIPVGMLLMAIQFDTPDPVADCLIALLSDNNTAKYVGIKPLFSLTLLLWQVSGLASLIMGIIFPIVGFRRSQRP